MHKKNRLGYIVWFVLCCLFTVVMVGPLVYSFINSLRGLYEAPTFTIPRNPQWINYLYAVTLIPFVNYLKSTLIITIIKVAFGLTVSFCYAFAFARLKARGRQVLFMILLSQMMIPGIATQIPTYITFANMGFKNTYWIWIVGGMSGDLFLIFTYKQYLENIPREIDEAAYIDGCSFFKMIPLIYFPICKSILVVGLFNCVQAGWGDYMTATMYLNSKMYPLATALFSAQYSLPEDPKANVEPIKLAAAFLFAIPLLVTFFFCQKQLVEGVTAGSVKG